MLYKEKALAAAVSEALLFNAISPRNDGTIDVEPILGQGVASFTRSGTVAHVRDHENVYRLVQANEARIQGARRVENYLPAESPVSWSNNTTITVTVGISDPDGGVTAFTVSATGATSIIADKIETDLPAGADALNSIWIRRRTGVGTINMYNGAAGAGLTDITSVISDSWQRLSTPVQTGITNTNNFIGLQIITSGDEIDIWHSQAEAVEGQSNQVPAEYVSAGIAKYYTTTNGNSVASNVVTEAPGIPLHPTIFKDNGRGAFGKFIQKILGRGSIRINGPRVLARYATRADSTAYVVGDRRIWGTGGTAGGAGWIQECTTAGTSDSSAPSQNETIGGTTADNTVVWTNKGHYKLAGYLGEPAATNSILQSRQFDTTWTLEGTPVLTQDQDGIDGVANTAWQIEDNNGAGFEGVQQAVTISNNTDTHTFGIRLLKDADTSRFPEIQFNLNDGTTQRIVTQVNTQTGAKNDRLTVGTVSSSVEDHGLWWRLVLTVANNTSGNVTAQILIYPAITTSLGSTEVAATGTTIFDQAQLELNTSVPSSPIITTTVSVTRNADVLSYDLSGNIEDVAGTLLVHNHYIHSVGVNARVIGNAGGNTHLYIVDSGGPKIGTFDGTLTDGPATPVDNRYQFAARWSGTVNQALSNGVAGVQGSYDGSYNVVEPMYIGNTGAGSNDQQGIFSDIRIYKKDLTQAVCESLTSAD